jgi:hypothetical protein
MDAERTTRIALAFARETSRSPTASLCNVCVEVLHVTGAGITVMGGEQAGPICVSTSSVAALEDLQFTIGQGPCKDAFRSGLPVGAPQLDDGAWGRWPSFVELARVSGINAAFAYPLAVDGAKVGVLSLYQRDEGPLTTAQHMDSLAIAEIVAETILSLQDQAPLGTLAPDLEDAVAYRAEIHQASGMIAVQLAISVADALLRIRGHAFAHSQPLSAVASDIVSRRLRLTDDRQNKREA